MTSIGQKLLAARKARGLSFEDVTRVTKMRSALIVALEADDYGKFPSITHARNFLLLYGGFLKVDVKDALAGLITPARIGVENYQYLNAVETDEKKFITRPTPRRGRVSAPPSVEQLPKTLGIFVVVIAFLIIGTYLAINLKRLNFSNKTEQTSGPSPTPFIPVVAPITPLVAPKLRNPLPEETPASETSYPPISDDHLVIPRLPRPPEP